MLKNTHVTKLEMDLEGVARNLQRVRERIHGKGVICVLKAFGYGTDDIALAKLLQTKNIDYFAVSFASEGVRLRNAGVKSRILILNPDLSSFDVLKEYCLEPTLLSMDQMSSYVHWAEQSGNVDLPIHININTGMNRLGFDPAELSEVENMIESNNIHVATVYSHLVGSDESCFDSQTIKQFELFEKACSAFSFAFKTHILNSSGVARFSNHNSDYVRVGLALLGIDESRKEWGLEPSVSLKTIVTQVRRVAAGEAISYGFTDSKSHDRDVAWLPLGYADGYPRSLGNGVGCVFVGGQLAFTAGRVCMGLVAIDVTGLGVESGDEVEIFGKNLCVMELAEKAETISYELFTRIHTRVNRTCL